MNKFLGYVLGACVGLLIVAPSIDYTIPVWINSFHWVWCVVASGLFGMMLVSKKIHLSLKVLAIYLFASCFFSQAPYLSFNAYMLCVICFYFFIALQHSDFKIVINFIEAAFWLEMVLVIFQLMGKDRLLNFDRSEKVFLGTVMQYMRFASTLALMAPFLVIKNKWYIIPISILCIFSKSSTFAISFSVFLSVWFLFQSGRTGKLISSLSFIGSTIIYAIYDWGSFRGAIIPSNGGRLISWLNVVQTWFMDTAKDSTFPMLEGPIKWNWILFGHGLDTFLPLFPIYKHDANPFPQAHNDWLQFGWEIGAIGLAIICWYTVRLIWRLYRSGEWMLLGGAASIAVNMFFAFPTRMTQTIPLITAFIALCEYKLKQTEI